MPYCSLPTWKQLSRILNMHERSYYVPVKTAGREVDTYISSITLSVIDVSDLFSIRVWLIKVHQPTGTEARLVHLLWAQFQFYVDKIHSINNHLKVNLTQPILLNF